MIEAEGRKGSDAHKAAVVGDTVGDPFKDTSGPSLNILLKLISVVALVIGPSIALSADGMTAQTQEVEIHKTIAVSVDAENEGADGVKKTIEVTTDFKDAETGTAQVIITTEENGVRTVTEKNITGTPEEIKAQVEALKGENINIDIRTESDSK
jgi:K(+)-stimulated pyrophosphate-energized sodium pump